jgi:hypothetical protein
MVVAIRRTGGNRAPAKGGLSWITSTKRLDDIRKLIDLHWPSAWLRYIAATTVSAWSIEPVGFPRMSISKDETHNYKLKLLSSYLDAQRHLVKRKHVVLAPLIQGRQSARSTISN